MIIELSKRLRMKLIGHQPLVESLRERSLNPFSFVSLGYSYVEEIKFMAVGADSIQTYWFSVPQFSFLGLPYNVS